jgi:glycosyltransferase involved in cell wall biosynthesis
LPLIQATSMHNLTVDVIIPVFNEEKSIGHVLDDMPMHLIRNVIVCNNGSTDRTAQVATSKSAIVVEQPIKGYGNACLKGMEYIANSVMKPDVVVYCDGDYSDHPEELPKLLLEIDRGAQLVIGSRALGVMEKGAMMPQQIFGNWLATNLIKMIYGYTFTDLGPFRAVRYDSLMAINMQDQTFGWTVEMQVKAAKQKLKCAEVPVSYRRRIGVSKVSGTLKGTILAGHKILWTIFKNI